MQGFNMGRYVPPHLEGVPGVTGNKLAGKHALGARASRLASEGILVVRFAMPFPVWCGSCPKPTVIGRGVRFNAEKKRAGTYRPFEDDDDEEEEPVAEQSDAARQEAGDDARGGGGDAARAGASKNRRDDDGVPIWSFVIRHAECGGELELRTDPGTASYVVVRGGRARDLGAEPAGESLVSSGVRLKLAAPGSEEAEPGRQDAIARLERTIAHRAALAAATTRIGELERDSGGKWADPYARNAALRREFRKGRKEREQRAAADGEIRDRLALPLGWEIDEGTGEDEVRARLAMEGLGWGGGGVGEEEDGGGGDEALVKPLVLGEKGGKMAAGDVGAKREQRGAQSTASTTMTAPRRTKAEASAAAAKERIRSGLTESIARSSRRSADPFLVDLRASGGAKTTRDRPAKPLLGVKRSWKAAMEGEDGDGRGRKEGGDGGRVRSGEAPGGTGVHKAGDPSSKSALVGYNSDED